MCQVLGSKLVVGEHGSTPSGSYARLLIFEGLMRLMLAAQQIGNAQLERIATVLANVIAQMSRASAGGAGGDEVLLVVQERCSKLLQCIPDAPSSADGGERLLLGEELALTVRRGPPELCAAALRVLGAALSSAIEPQVRSKGEGCVPAAFLLGLVHPTQSQAGPASPRSPPP